MQIFLDGDPGKPVVPHWIIFLLVASVFVIPGSILIVKALRMYCV